ncbi:tRNA wybutosine-synthesizing protein 4 [Scleropages formosus]|uniref:tRNA wybutosine-synthesizing protein 4 n=1 Tax=Scleropages formosus TaxID=113540 RepID=A0A8C9SQY4_SCLFO|nr:tRNA wybutosine-synthesizing protein 4 [Scleropages formosus]
MREKRGSDAAVQGTNDSSVLSKASAAAQGYFEDAFIKDFVCKVSRRAPLINKGYYVRWSAVDHCVRHFLHVTEGCAKRQILSLGAGFDSLYFRLHAEGLSPSLVVFEVDFPDVARRKATLICASDHLKGALKDWEPHSPLHTGPVCLFSSQYRLLGVDVRDEGKAEEAFGTAALQRSAPTLLLSEVALTYMDTERSDALIGWAAQLLPHALFVMYEQIRPHDPFGRVMRDHFLKLNSALHALIRYPDTSAQMQRFLDRGWERCVCLDMNQFYLGLLSEKERSRVEKLEPFDEFEEWHQKCSHYFILTASKGPLTSQALIAFPLVSPLPTMSPVLNPKLLRVQLLPMGLKGPAVEGLGMASALITPGVILLCGGAMRSGRVNTAKLLLREQKGWTSVSAESQTDWGVRMYHTATAVPGWGVVVLGGRSSPLRPVCRVLRVALSIESRSELHAVAGSTQPRLSVTDVSCAGDAPRPRWRHSATLLSHGGKKLLFVFGGRTEMEPVLCDGHFLNVDDQRWETVSIEGAVPAARHSHSACACEGGVVISGGLGRGGIPLGDAVFLLPTTTGFRWEELVIKPPVVPRYSHHSHVIGQQLLLIGGVWLQADGVPGVAIIHLATGSSVEYSMDISEVPWPLMLQSFCSELLDEDGTVITLIGGGGNCFSFGTHLNPQPVSLNLTSVL